MKNYLNSLIRKHRQLDKKIKSLRHDGPQAQQLKKLRLHLKDRIQQLRRGPVRQSV